MILIMRFLVVGKNPSIIYTKDYYANNSLAEILLRYSNKYIIWVNPHTQIVYNYIKLSVSETERKSGNYYYLKIQSISS
jgi:hypothetical protein